LTEGRAVAATEEAGLREAILSDPDDDGPRLVYADWLDEHGQPERAEFIRLQCKHARLYHEAISVSGDPESERMEQLEKEHGPRWLAEVPKLPGVRWGFWRGLPARVQMLGWQDFRRNARRLFQAAPVEYVTFERLSYTSGRALARSAYLKRIRVLDLAYGAALTPGTVRALLRSPALTRLQTLRLFHSHFGDEAAVAVANCPHLTGLRLLSMYSSGVDDTGAFSLAASPHLPKTCFIELSRNRFGDEAERALRKRFGRRINI
jgi:uncharacterized protein (TIGR02996 family)